MRLHTRIISVAASVALVAGAGALATGTASAANKNELKVSGKTFIQLPTALVDATADAGVQIAPIKPSKAQTTMGEVVVSFPVTGPPMDGLLYHRGGLSFASDNTGITLTATKPWITWATGRSIKDASISVVIGGIPAGNPLASLNGKRVDLFTVPNYQRSVETGKATQGHHGWTRTDTIGMTGKVKLTRDAATVKALNTLLVGKKTLFTPGMKMGSLDSEEFITEHCKTKKQCSP